MNAELLLDVADPVVARDRDRAVVGLFLADDEPEERGLAVAVPADEAHPLPAVDLEADALEQRLLAVPLR